MSLAGGVSRSLTQFRTNPVRTLLTLLGMVFGVASVVAMVSIGQGARQEILATIEAIGADCAHVKATKIEDEKIGELIVDSVGLSRVDASAIRAVVPSVREVAYRAEHPLRVSSLPVPTSELHVFPVSPNLFELHGLHVTSGRPLLAADHEEERRVAVLGKALAERAFPSGALGKYIRIDYAYFEVVGVLAEKQALGGDLPIDPDVYNDSILVPYSTAATQLATPPAYGELDVISVRVGDMAGTVPAKAALERLLASLHGGAEDYRVIAPAEIVKQKQDIQTVFNIVLICIAAISLVVGGIGVMNIMLANIMERVAEIGLRRSVGARKRDIRNQFLLEAVVICVVGGSLGIVLGLGSSLGVALLVDLPVSFAWESLVVSVAISGGVGLLFGIVPAMRAANVNPIEALNV